MLKLPIALIDYKIKVKNNSNIFKEVYCMLNSTKKFLSTVMAAVLTCSAFAATAAADNPDAVGENHCSEIHEERIDDYELELINSGMITNESVAEFNAYIASLDEESAAIILSDKDLVLTMKMTTYWHPDDGGIATYANCTLPLQEYPAGTYFSYDGKACTCHNDCDVWIPSGYSKDRCYNAVTGTSGNCIRYAPNGSIQCCGFADYVFKQYNGVNRSDSNAVNKTLASVTSTSIKDYANKYLKRGSHFRFYLNQTYTGSDGKKYYIPHSIIITDVTSSGISYYQANYGGRCLVSTGYKTWDQLASWIHSITNAWTV